MRLNKKQKTGPIFSAKQNRLKAIALLTGIFFCVNNLAYGQSIAFANKKDKEMGSRPFSQQVHIPAQLGTIEKIHTRGTSTVILIQDAHSQPEAQRSIEKILQYLDSNYGMENLFFEGAFHGPLSKKLLNFQKNPAINRILAERLVDRGLAGGGGLYSLGNTPNTNFYGVENPGLYVKNLCQFRAVYQGKAESDIFLSVLEEKINLESARLFNPDLFKFYREWSAFLNSRREILGFYDTLLQYAKNFTQLDLMDSRNQFEYPQLVRLFRLRAMGKEKPEQGSLEKEKNNLLTWFDKEVPEKIKNTSRLNRVSLEKALAWNEKSLPNDMRAYFENFYNTSHVYGFSFKRYPALTRQIGRIILEQERSAEKINQEAEALTEKILTQLALSPEEKRQILIFRDYQILKKLFSLELNKKEYRLVSNRAAQLSPAVFLNRLGLKSGQRSQSLEQLFKQAIRFYQTAEQREEVFFKNMLKTLKASRSKRSAIITGGFHSEGLERLLSENGFSFIRVMPHLSKIISAQNYFDNIASGF